MLENRFLYRQTLVGATTWAILFLHAVIWRRVLRAVDEDILLTEWPCRVDEHVNSHEAAFLLLDELFEVVHFREGMLALLVVESRFKSFPKKLVR
jgi:hypothetical protein